MISENGIPKMRVWLARLSFSFLILSGLLIWQGYRGYTERDLIPPWQTALYLIGGLVLLILGFTGIRDRHRDRNHRER